MIEYDGAGQLPAECRAERAGEANRAYRRQAGLTEGQISGERGAIVENRAGVRQDLIEYRTPVDV